MATFTVTTAADFVNASDGKLSLREAVTQANATAAADTIVFASAIEGQTLRLTGGELALRNETTIDGDQNNDGVGMVLSGGGVSRIIQASGAGIDVVFRDIEFQGGNALYGGAVEFRDGGTLNVHNCRFPGNCGYQYFNNNGYGTGGAIFSLVVLFR